MFVHRCPIRQIRNEYRNTADRLAAFHERRVDNEAPSNNADSENGDLPRIVVHFVPERAFSEDAIRFSASELFDREAYLRPYGGQTGKYGKMKPGRIETVNTATADYKSGTERLILFENLVFELDTTWVTEQSNRGRIFDGNSFVEQLEQNLATLLGLLSVHSDGCELLATATYRGFNDALITCSGRPAPITDDEIPTRTVSMDVPKNNHELYEGHVESINELLRPVVQSAGRHGWDLERPDAINIPDLMIEE
ncbi:hypothetical protein [Halorubrum sp. DM2]|uniref:hypothetical protein n=1 Tax=Halorubrum sp. DM2 TaxID=2527867 RepID=UPI0024B870C0|nr:hypothetical protein [Halorubrum sp. DM2]